MKHFQTLGLANKSNYIICENNYDVIIDLPYEGANGIIQVE